MTDSAADALAHVQALERLISQDAERLTGPAGRAAKTEVLAVADSLGRLSHMGRRGVKLSGGYDLSDGGQTLTVKLRPAGAWVIAEKKSRAHVIAPKRRRARAASGGRPPAVAASGWGHPAAAVHHPGGRGRQGITRAFGRVRRVIPDTIHLEQLRAMESIFHG